MAYTIATPIQGQNLSASLYGNAVRNAINDLDTRMNKVEVIAVARKQKVSVTADSATFTAAETALGSITTGLISGWTYQVSFHTAVSGTVLNDELIARIRQDTIGGTQMRSINFMTNIPVIDLNGTNTSMVAEHTSVATASKTFFCTVTRVAGTGTYQYRASGSRPSYMFIDLVVVP